MAVTLNGHPLAADAPVRWELVAGAAPYISTVYLRIKDAKAVMRESANASALISGFNDSIGTGSQSSGTIAGPLTLVIDRVEVKGLWAIRTAPGLDPYTLGVVLADGRWLLTQRAVSRGYNIPRRSGEVRITGSDLAPQLRPQVDDLKFKRWSLKDTKTAWKPLAALKDLLADLGGRSFKVPDSLPQSDSVPFQNVRLEGYGDSAVQVLLSYLPGTTIYPRLDGTFRVGNDRDGSESEILALRGADAVFEGGGWANVVDRSLLMPTRWRVHFVTEQELKFTYDETNAAGASYVRGRESLYLENVLKSPDFTATVDGVTINQGQWARIGDATVGGLLKSWPGKVDPLTGKTFRLTLDLIRRLAYPAFQRLIAHLVNGPIKHDEVWARRLAAVLAGWRRTFKIPEVWLDRIETWRPYRVAILDAEGQQTRAPATVYADWAMRPSTKGFLSLQMGIAASARQWENTSYSAQIKSGQAAPFEVLVEDLDQGIFRLSPKLDVFGETDTILPGKPANPQNWNYRHVRTVGNGKALNAAADGTVSLTADQVRLASGWKMSTILTVVRGSPNDEGKFHVQEVSANQVADALGQPIGGARGPVRDLIVPATVSTARFAWRDEDEETIKNAFFDGLPVPDTLLVNRTEVEAVAKAFAAAEASRLVDNAEGAFACPLHRAEPTGACKSVAFVKTPDFLRSTVYAFTEPAPLSVDNFLPHSVKALVRRLVIP